jgi:hypothetical protein
MPLAPKIKTTSWEIVNRAIPSLNYHHQADSSSHPPNIPMNEASLRLWLQQLPQPSISRPATPPPLTPPANTPSPSRRKRKLSFVGLGMEDSGRSTPKRRRTGDDDSSISVADDSRSYVSSSTRLTDPNEWPQLAHRPAGSRKASPKRARSPVRDQLKHARPPIICHPPAGRSLPPNALALRRYLETEIETGVVPLGLKVCQ